MDQTSIIKSIVDALGSSGHKVKAAKGPGYGEGFTPTFADGATVEVLLRERSGKTTVFVGGYGIAHRRHFPQPKAGHRWADIAAQIVLCAEDHRRAKADQKANDGAWSVVRALNKELGFTKFAINTDGKGGITLELHKIKATPDQIRAVVRAAVACGLAVPRPVVDEDDDLDEEEPEEDE